MKELLIYICNQIPKGQVDSFGDIATQINHIYIINGENIQTSGRLVGRLLSNMNTEDSNKLPRQRVVNNKGFVSSLKLGARGILQIQLLREEGVVVSDEGTLDMPKYRFAKREL